MLRSALSPEIYWVSEYLTNQLEWIFSSQTESCTLNNFGKNYPTIIAMSITNVFFMILLYSVIFFVFLWKALEYSPVFIYKLQFKILLSQLQFKLVVISILILIFFCYTAMDTTYIDILLTFHEFKLLLKFIIQHFSWKFSVFLRIFLCS